MANVQPSTGGPAAREEVRKQLAGFFANGGVGDLKKSPGAYEAVQQRIGAMSDEELSHFQKLIAETPDWRNMPQVIAAAIPPDVMKGLERAGADFTARIPGAERMRDDVRTLATVLRVLPDAKLKELGIDRKLLDSLDGAFTELSPLQAAMLQKQLSHISAWGVKSSSAMEALPPELRRGALALAKHGPLTEADRRSLEQFRADLTALLGTIKTLPPSIFPTVAPAVLQDQIDRVSLATSEVLFMIRDQLPPEKLAALQKNVAILDRAAHLSNRDRAALETFRADVVETFSRLQPEGTPDDFVRDKVAQLTPAHLMILKDKLAATPEWKELLPLYYRTVSAPGFSARIAAVRGPAPDPVHMAELQAFRAQALQYIQASAGETGVDAALVARASKAVANADPVRLEFIRSLTEQMDGARPDTRLKLVTHIDVDFDCDVDIGIDTISLDFICDPIESAIEGAVSGFESMINSVQAALQSAIDTVAATVNSLVQGIIDVVGNIWSFIQTIPNLAWQAISAALDLLLDINLGNGLTLRALLQGGIQTAVPALQTAFHLNGSWWTAIAGVSLPAIPCPAAGTHTPFGDVGSGEAVTKYNRYKFFMDKIIGLIPDTEVSLKVKIPAEVLYAAYEFLGVCLEDAAADANDALLESRHTSVTSGIGNLSTQVATTTSALSVQLTNAYNNLIAHGNAQTNTLSSAIAATGNTLGNQINTSTTTLTNQVDTEAKAQRALDLRLQIELNLQAGEGKALAMFQLPQLQGGYLELVRDTVNNAITSMLAAGQSINQAQKYFSDAQTLISQTRYKDAFKSLQTAYRELTR